MKLALAAALACAACSAQSVAIVNSGSTNTAGFEIVVEKSGAAEYTSHPRPLALHRGETPVDIHKTIPKPLAERLYRDVARARPLASLPARHCAKSASFGTRLTVVFGDDESPDLSCGASNPQSKALLADVKRILKMFRAG